MQKTNGKGGTPPPLSLSLQNVALRANPYYRGAVSDHFDGRRFFNPGGRAPSSLSDLLIWQFDGKRADWPTSWPSPFKQAKPARRVKGNRLRVTMVGHASLLIQTAGLNILTDPVWSQRASPIAMAGPIRVNPPGIAFEDLPPIDIVLVSHNHYDHMDIFTLAQLHQNHDPLVIAPLGNDTILCHWIPALRVRAVDWGESVKVPGGAVVHAEPVHHWSARGVGDRRMALWAGFVVATNAGKVYFAGDTGFHGGVYYDHLAAKHGDFRLAILPIGAYEPRWFMEAQHQDPDEAVQGMLLCNAAHAAGCHWGTFQLTNEPVDEPRDRLFQALDGRRISRDRFRPLLPGEVWDIP